MALIRPIPIALEHFRHLHRLTEQSMNQVLKPSSRQLSEIHTNFQVNSEAKVTVNSTTFEFSCLYIQSEPLFNPRESTWPEAMGTSTSSI
jgi:hypothetical protein